MAKLCIQSQLVFSVSIHRPKEVAFSAFPRLLSAHPFLLGKKFCLFVSLLKKQQIRLSNFYGESKILFFSFVFYSLLLPTEGPGRFKQCGSNSAISSLRSQFKNLLQILLQESPLVCFLITFFSIPSTDVALQP